MHLVNETSMPLNSIACHSILWLSAHLLLEPFNRTRYRLIRHTTTDSESQ
ncbi:hypothetical protein DN35_3154 [Vibrio cholerae]|nr:hypothetical protein DN35_3154 [Vibrio cholerae]KFE07790.1 hypothetical protein DN36_3225 [Vibrio cholerae]